MDGDATDEEENDMNGHLAVNSHIDITQTLVRLYIFLAQSLDRALNATTGQAFPEHELQSHLVSSIRTIRRDGPAFGEPCRQGQGRG